jgi:dienelactone hydrolase
MGWDLGANAIMRGLKANPEQPTFPIRFFTRDPKHRFKAGIMYHPLCSPAATTLYAPLVIFKGDKDKYFPSGGCDTFPKENRAGGEPFRIIVYPGATNFFDYGEIGQDHDLNRFAPDPAATQDSIKRIKAFLLEKL